MDCANFIDFYEILDVPPDATAEQVDEAFKQCAELRQSKTDEDAPDQDGLKHLIDAYETLSDSERRAEFDAVREEFLEEQSEVEEPYVPTDPATDREQRRIILKIFAEQRRRNMKDPGVSTSKINELTGISSKNLTYHLWYFHEKKWVNREENGLLAITALGVDQVASSESE